MLKKIIILMLFGIVLTGCEDAKENVQIFIF